MKLPTVAAIVAGLLGWSAIAPASAAAPQGPVGTVIQVEKSGATEFSSQRRSRHRRDDKLRYARSSYRPHYYDRPDYYRPYGLVPFFFGLSFPYRTW